MTISTRNLLQYNELIELFPSHIRKDIHNKSTTKIVKPGDYVMKVGEGPPFFMAAVLSGRLRMFVNSLEGKEMLITMVERGEIFGEMSVVDSMPRAVSVMAETECLLTIMTQDYLLPLLFSYPEVLIGLLKTTCYRIRLYIHTMELIALQNLPVRLGRYLMRLARDYGIEKDGAIVIHAGLNQVGMGQQVAATRESINKQLKAFVQMGLIAVEGECITLLNREGLKKFINPMEE